MSNSKITLKEINKLAVPAILAGISEPLIALADTAIVGHLGSVDLAAVGIASSFFLLLVWVLSSMKSAISAIVAKYYGMNDLEHIKTLVPQSVIFAFLVGLVFLFATLPFQENIFEWYKASGDILNKSMAYYNIRAYGYPLSLSIFTIFGVFRGCQNTSWAMIISLVGGALNLVLDIALVYGTPLSPPLGIEGAAWATLISQAIMLVFALVILGTKYAHTVSFSFKINPEFKSLLGITGNLLIRTFFLNIAYYLGNRFSTSYGKEYIAAHTIAMNIWLFSAFFIDGYANAGNAIAGKLLGANDISQLKTVGKKLAGISVLIGALLGLVYLGSYPWMGSIFTEDQKVITVFQSIFWIVIISQPINGVAFSLDGIFKGLGRAALLRNTLILGTVFVFIPVIYGLDYLSFQMHAVWYAFFFWMIFRGGSLLFMFLKKLDK